MTFNRNCDIIKIEEILTTEDCGAVVIKRKDLIELGKITKQELSNGLKAEVESKATQQEVTEHKTNTAMPHKYLDEGEEVEYQGIKYRLVIINGEPFLEVVEV